MYEFVQPSRPDLESYWRGIILFGSNSATYKFALGLALLELAQNGKSSVSLEELAEPYSRYLTTHMKAGKKQGTSASSQFLQGLQQYNRQEIDREKMIENTVLRGFTNVIDAFHNLKGVEVPRFYVDERTASNKIRLTDNLLKLANSSQFQNLPHETEARWKLVETAWDVGLSRALLVVKYDATGKELFVTDTNLKRTDITSARNALNGYQKGKCFYCFRDIHVTDHNVHIDHVFPHMLKQRFRAENIPVNLDGVWNLVMACQDCNLEKSDQRPHFRYIERLYRRNEFFIASHHPLRETLINQTGVLEATRRSFLIGLFEQLTVLGKMQNWRAYEEFDPAF